MAQQIICDLCESAMADFMITNTNNGDTIAVCAPDIETFALGIKTAIEVATNPATEVEDQADPKVEPGTETEDQPEPDAEPDIEANAGAGTTENPNPA